MRGQSAVDTIVGAPYAGFMNLQVPPELEAKLTRLAAESGRTAEQVTLDLLASSVDHDEWFRGEVEKGRTAAREGRLIEHDDVAARMDRRYRGGLGFPVLSSGLRSGSCMTLGSFGSRLTGSSALALRSLKVTTVQR